MKQLDIFGNEVDRMEEKIFVSKGGRRYKRMQELFGTIQGKQCKTCKHLCSYRQSRTWYKCGLWYQTSSQATDIRLKDVACGKYEESGVGIE